jgi:hypothetical protein
MGLTVLALDLSIKSCGFALWSTGDSIPACGTWELAGGVAHAPRAFCRLHRRMKDVNDATPLHVVAYEDTVPPHMLRGHSDAATVKALAGLAGHVESFCAAMGIRCCAVNQSTWRRHFLGAMPRGVKTADYKHMAMTKCRELGFEVIKHDAAEACGLLDYQLSIEGIIAPWREGILQRQMTPATDGRRAQA